MSLTESIVENAALTWFHLRQGNGGRVGKLGYGVGHGPQGWDTVDRMDLSEEN